MKNTITLLLLLLTVTAHCQVSFPERHPELLKGKTVKILEPYLMEKLGFGDFYTDIKLFKDFRGLPIAKQKELLLGKLFTVEEIGPLSIDSSGDIDTFLTLKGSDGKIVYYRYSSVSDTGYNLEVIGGLTIPQEFYCELIQKDDTYKRYENRVPMDGLTIERDMDIDYKGAEYTIGYKRFMKKTSTKPIGIVLVFDNGQKLQKDIAPPSITDKGDGDYLYMDNMLLSQKEFEILLNHKIVSIILDGVEEPFKYGEKAKGISKCLTEIK